MTELSEYLTIAQATKVIPGRPSIGTVYRWIRKGIDRNGRAIRLKHHRAGGLTVTTKRWITEFFEALAAAEDDGATVAPPEHRPAVRLLSHEQADAMLAAEGL